MHTLRSRGSRLTRSLGLLLLAPLAVMGCGKGAPPGKAVPINPKVHVYLLQKRTITADIGQPAFVYAYEQTSLFPKVSGFIDKWLVDIGDRVHKDQELAHIAVPELIEERNEALAQAELDKVLIEVDQKLVQVAQSNVDAAEAQVKAAQENVKKFEAGVKRWTLDVNRLNKIPDLVNQQVLLEAQRELEVNIASRDAATADVAAAEAMAISRKADVAKARADVDAARAKARVSETHVKKLDALVSYTYIRAPYDGVIIDRNANQGDYVEPTKGDFSAGRGASNQSAGQGKPLYVTATTDKVRVFVDVPESQAAFVQAGTKAQVVFEAQRGEELSATVTRTSWSLEYRTRTLRAEIDLPNPGARLFPGMYAYAHLLIVRKDAWAVPDDAVVVLGEQKCIFLLDGSKAIRTPVQAGVSDGKYTELFHKQVKGVWVNFDGTEQVILGNLAELSDGRDVEVETGGE